MLEVKSAHNSGSLKKVDVGLNLGIRLRERDREGRAWLGYSACFVWSGSRLQPQHLERKERMF